MFLRQAPTAAAAVPATPKKIHPTELSGAASNGFSYVATAGGYRILRDGVEVALGVGQACVETNAQRAIQALANRGVSLT